MMTVNALSNYVIFRARDLRSAFMIGAAFPVLDIALLVCLVRLDPLSAIGLVPYLVYRVYGVYWGYALWKANPESRLGSPPFRRAVAAGMLLLLAATVAGFWLGGGVALVF